MDDIKENLLSVIVPIYNTEDYLRKCLDSIIGQRYRNLEIICIDDGSTDKSGELLDEYALNDDRVRVIHKSNEGLVSTRKMGISIASGNYVAYVDSDDWIDECMFSEMMNLAVSNNADVVTSGCIREYGKKTTVENEKMSPGVYSKENLVDIFLANMIGHDYVFEQNVKVNIWNKIFRKDLIMKYQMETDNMISIGEDAAVTYPTMINANTIVVSGQNYYHYRIRQDSMTRRAASQEYESLVLIERHLKKQFNISRYFPYKDKQLLAILTFIRLLAAPETIVEYRGNYLYPYLSVNKNDKIIVYGAGRYGKKLIPHLINLGANIVGVSDQIVKEDIIPVEKICDYKFDKIILAILNNSIALQVIQVMTNLGIPSDKISRIDLIELLKFENNF